MQRLLVFILVFFTSLMAKSQNAVLSGKVVDQDSVPISFASIEIIKANGGVINKIAAEDGGFELLIDKAGFYTIKITHSAYKDYNGAIRFDSGKNGAIYILTKLEQTLGAVTITASKRPIITRKIDRTVMDVQNNPVAAGRSSLDVFRLAPGVFVNNGTIFINGVGGAKVMINGRLLTLGGADLQGYLQNLKASDIKSIEIIPHPPAEYEAEGSAGIINIILKKNTRSGLNGRIGTDYSIGLGKYPSYNPSTSFNYRKNKLSVGGSYSYANEKSFQQVNQARDFTNNGKYTADNYEIIRRKASNLRANIGYDINTSQFLEVSYSGQFSQSKYFGTSVNTIISPNDQENIYSKGAFPKISDTKYSNIGLSYSIQTDTIGSKLDFFVDYTHNNRNGLSGTNTRTFDINEKVLTDTIFNFYYPSIAKIWVFDGKYLKKWNEKISMTIGGKGASTQIENDNNYDVYLNNTWNSNHIPGFNYLYKEEILAGFVNVSGKLKAIEYKLGLRGENSNISGILTEKGGDTTLARKYFNLFPAIFVKQNLNQEGSHYLSLSYNKRIVRPSYFELNPYKYFIDNYTIQTGNPLLNPEFTDAIELASLWQGKYYFAVGYSHTKDIIKQVIEINTNEQLITVKRNNAGNSKVFSITMNVPLSIAKWWNSNNNLLLTYTKSSAPQFNLSKSSFLFQAQNDFIISPTMSLSLNAFYTPRILTGNIISGRLASFDIALQKSFFKKKLVSTISLADLFYTSNFRAVSYYYTNKINISQKEQTRLLTLSLVYNFNIGQSFKSKKQERIGAEEKERLK